MTARGGWTASHSHGYEVAIGRGSGLGLQFALPKIETAPCKAYVLAKIVDGKTAGLPVIINRAETLNCHSCHTRYIDKSRKGKHKKWVQYLGRQKSFFYNPFLQNRNHVKHLKKYLGQFGNLPSISFVTTTSRGKWKVRNLGLNDYLLGYNCHLMNVYQTLPDSKLMLNHYSAIINKLTPLARPSEEMRKRHIDTIKSGRNEK